MKTIRINILIIGILAIILASCEKDPIDPTDPTPTPTTCETANATYNGDIANILAVNCLGSSCHGSGAPFGDFTSYARIKPQLDNGNFEREVLITQGMPRGFSMRNSELEKIRCWVDNGFPEN